MAKSYFMSFLLLFVAVSGFSQKVKEITYTYTDLNGYTCSSHLFIDGKESLFVIDDPRPSGQVNTSETNFYKIYNDKWSRIFYKNGAIEITRLPLYGRELIYTPPSAEKPKLTGKAKVIGSYKCQEAIVKRGGQVFYVWFAPSVPVTVGPWGLYNLPGMVIEVRNENYQNFKIQLTNVSNDASPKKYLEFKKYLLSRKILSSEAYNKEITKVISNKKREVLTVLAQYNATLEMEGEAAYVEHLIDIPNNLIKDLQKIK